MIVIHIRGGCLVACYSEDPDVFLIDEDNAAVGDPRIQRVFIVEPLSEVEPEDAQVIAGLDTDEAEVAL